MLTLKSCLFHVGVYVHHKVMTLTPRYEYQYLLSSDEDLSRTCDCDAEGMNPTPPRLKLTIIDFRYIDIDSIKIY